MKYIDIPPVWLALFLGIAWVQATYVPALSLAGPVTGFLGGVLVGAGVILMALALAEFRKHRTTVIPHQTASSLIESGIFKRTRNPIYLGDVAILAGLILRWDAVLCLPLIPVFVWVLERRFILPEENRLRRAFHADFARYERKVRRWI